MVSKSAPKPQVDAIAHKDKRKNIPTAETSRFMADDEAAPKTLLYPRDPSLDPQLVWKGKDEQDARDLAVPVVPVYVQEKIHPQALINALPRKEDAAGAQLDLFAGFDGVDEDDLETRVDFYHHEFNWSNRMILGDSLLVMASLAEKEGLKGKVQMIYLDPPYGIKFGSNWQVSTRRRDVKDGKVEDATRQPEQVRAFRDTWKLGIHSYLAYLRDRLTLARDLLTETGSIFAQIGDENVHLVRSLLDEVFGSENFIGLIPFVKTTGAGSPAIGTNVLASIADYLVWYAKDKPAIKYRQLYDPKRLGEAGATQYTWLESPEGCSERPLESDEIDNPSKIPEGWKIFAHDNFTSQTGAETTQVPVRVRGRTFTPNKGGWKTNAQGIERLLGASRFMIVGDSLRYKRRLADFSASPINNVWLEFRTSGFGDPKKYVVQTNAGVVERCLLMTTDPGDLVLDPTCGSGTTAYMAENWGRRWITIDTSRVALALARTRLMAAKYPYYLLADSPGGLKKEAEVTGRTPPAYPTEGDIRKGFVYQRVPHVTLKSIANNTEIDAIHEEFQPTLDGQRNHLNDLLGQRWEEWEVPREPGKGWSDDAVETMRLFWETRRTRQARIDASIARAADTEYLFDKPYEDSKRIRVSGPLTVESLSPHRVFETDENLDGQISPQEQAQRQDFATMILDHLKVAGVQNTRRGERLKFTRLEPFTGSAWLHAQGEYEESGATKRVAVSIGPENGTVGPGHIKEAAKEALQGVGFDLLVVCGFAFDALAGETANEFQPVETPGAKGLMAESRRQYGKLPVMLARMNPDLSMGDDLLKKTGAGNLFMVFGEPDVELQRQADGQYVVRLLGVDVYDPTTGAVRSSSTDDIACWFIDTDYNEESFFVRHAYFTGADQPYEKLQRALRADIDEAAWASLYSTTSRPFPRPARGKIAIKTINHYGDEVMKVYTLG